MGRKRGEFGIYIKISSTLVLLFLIIIGINPAGHLYYDMMAGEYVEKYTGFTNTNHGLELLHNYHNATNPSHSELLVFLKSDTTDEIPYDPDEFECADYAVTLHNNAERAGIRAGVVTVDFDDKRWNNNGHALNVFRTTDRGMIYIDCTSSSQEHTEECLNDKIIDKLEVGVQYKPEPLFRKNYDYEELGIVKRINIYW
ncbi:hypothetical protein [Methanohalophilus profundi]|uniref:hypothetical protein n=1 Tax=Methanohalophilus profundi TaxID=2138083 RepID=UPI00101C3314|nr:hypothetical protein [Methanohalophilus profundi]